MAKYIRTGELFEAVQFTGYNGKECMEFSKGNVCDYEMQGNIIDMYIDVRVKTYCRGFSYQRCYYESWIVRIDDTQYCVLHDTVFKILFEEYIEPPTKSWFYRLVDWFRPTDFT